MDDGPHSNRLDQLSSLDALITAIGERNFTPGWIPRPKPLLWKEMRSEFVPAHWNYADAKAAMGPAGRLIGTDQAERRNFIMRNPIPGNDFATLRSLVCAYQSILPGEKARSHRHASHALRVILESRGSYSIVDGEKTPMETGDIVLTPGWSWHGHGHEGSDPAYWFDGLDVPLTHLLEPMFFEEHPNSWEPVKSVAQNSSMRFTWADTAAALVHAPADTEGYFGKTIELPAPTMPTITLKVHRWDAGWRNRPYRHASNSIYVVMDGGGQSSIGDRTFHWDFGDAIAAPAWCRIEHRASANTVMFSMSDENLMRWARYYRLEAMG